MNEFYICQLCHEPSETGTEHKKCHDEEQAYADFVSEQMASLEENNG